MRIARTQPRDGGSATGNIPLAPAAGFRDPPPAMLISHRHRFAFIHVPKTAGSSVAFALWPHADHVDHYWMTRSLALVGIHVNHYAPYRMKKFRTHTPAAVLQRQLPAEVFADLFKFAFVRNPWDLLVSSYHYLREKVGHHRGPVASRLQSFAAYAAYEIRRGKMSQSAMLTGHDGRLLVDFVGRFESLADDFAYACRRIGVEMDLPRANSSRHADYRSYYDDRLAAEVGRFFAADVERFGYAFDDAAAGRQRGRTPAPMPGGRLRRAA